MTSEDPYVRRMTLAFPGNLFQTEALRQRIEFVEDDILCDVDLSGNSVVCDDAVTLKLMTKLQEQLGCEKLNLSQTRIGPSAVGMLAELLARSEVLQTLQLRKLSVLWSTIAAPLCEGVKASRGLRRLDLSDNIDLSRFGVVLLEAVNLAKELRELAISGIDFVDVSALTLQVAFQNLEVLEFGSNSCDLSDVQWSHLPKLTTLNLRQAQRLGSLIHIADAVKLHSLDLSDTPMTEEACQNVAALLMRKDCKLAVLKLARCPLQAAWLQPFLRAFVVNSSVTESLDLTGSPIGDLPSTEWSALATRMHQVKRLQLSNCRLRSVHIEELVRSVFENDAPSMLSELDITNNLVGETAEGADWVAELLHMPQITAFYCGNNRIQNATAIYLKLRSERDSRKLIGEVCSASSRRDDKANVFTNEQLAWLNKKAYTKVVSPDADSFVSRS